MIYGLFVSPYFDHDAFMHQKMHHTMHVLDAPVAEGGVQMSHKVEHQIPHLTTRLLAETKNRKLLALHTHE